MSERRKVLSLFCEQKDYMNERINDGIEKYRKGNAKIVVKDSSGAPVRNAKVCVKQTNHEFKFGANLFMLDEFETTEKNEKHNKAFADVFNMATLPFYWNANEPEKGQKRYDKNSEKMYRRPTIDLCMEYCKENGIEPRAHCLNYDLMRPKWTDELSLEEYKKVLEERFKELAERYSDDIPCWEVINETLCVPAPEKRSYFFYEPDLVEWSFKTAEKYFKNNEITINESNWQVFDKSYAFKYNRSAYYMLIERALKNGAKIDAIGFQCHVCYKKEEEARLATSPYYDPKFHYNLLDTYAQFGKPLQITEVTVPAFSNDPEDEEIQAEVLKNLYSIWFSHPDMEQIVYWNLADGYAFVSDPDPKKVKASMGDMTRGENIFYGGLFRFDMTPKPAYYALKNLIKNEWNTKEQLITDNDGVANFKGFYGTYDVEVEVNGKIIKKQINLSKSGDKEFNIEV
ncbi:MAG: endo-1,4-beta-xylanase [Clostridia bacterium]|nr:endo-1,4-beta-xylanase [Clostridia bacterium]